MRGCARGEGGGALRGILQHVLNRAFKHLLLRDRVFSALLAEPVSENHISSGCRELTARNLKVGIPFFPIGVSLLPEPVSLLPKITSPAAALSSRLET